MPEGNPGTYTELTKAFWGGCTAPRALKPCHLGVNELTRITLAYGCIFARPPRRLLAALAGPDGDRGALEYTFNDETLTVRWAESNGVVQIRFSWARSRVDQAKKE